MSRFIVFVISVIMLSQGAMGQTATDTPSTFSYEDFFREVMENHPMAAQADLKASAGQAGLQSAKGAFDPKIGGGFDQKAFDGKNYFRKFSSGVTVPTTLGVKFNGDFDQASGDFLNPEWNLPETGLYSVGMEVNLGRGLLIDKARAGLQMAKISAQSTEAERQMLLNDLALVSTAAYWKWVQAYHQMEIYRQALELARVRLEGVRSSFQFGDRPAIDTTEALIQVQNRLFLYNESVIKYTSFRLQVSNFIWDEEGQPLELLESVRPPSIPELQAFDLSQSFGIDSVDTDHPVLQFYTLKLQALNVNRRYKAEMLKPKVALKYNFINGGNEFATNASLQNYKIGMEFSMPLFLRKERGELELAKIKLMDSQLELDRKTWELETKVISLEQKITTTALQIDQFSDAVNNYNRLLQGEITKFNGGESSLFLVNSREQSLIKAQMQLLGRLTAIPVFVAEYNWALGRVDADLP